MDVSQRCQSIEFILADVDGVLTDGRIIYDNQGIEIKQFHIRDGLGIKLWQRAGCKFGLITGRNSHIVELRAVELGIPHVRQGVTKRLQEAQQLLAELGIKPAQLCYIGDDLPDMATMKFAGLGVAVADACPELRAAAHYVTRSPGGKGAVRETVEMILKAQRRWEDLLQSYETS